MDRLQLLALQAWSHTSDEGLLVIDDQGHICLFNQRLQELLRLKRVPTSVAELLAQLEGAMPELRTLFPPENRLDRVQWGSLRIQKSPAYRLSWEQTPVFDQGQWLGSVTVFHDATTHGQLDLTRQSFLSMISHDLRTPLSTILGFAELLYHNRGSLSDDEQKEFLEHIIKNANELSRYTQVALDIMYLEADLQSFEIETVVLNQFVKHWMSDALHRYPAQELVFENGAASGPRTNISPAALHKILHILVEFALRESPPNDPVAIRLNYDDARAHILIQHRAPDLSRPDAEKLFQRLQPRDLSDTGRPQLHRMQLYVANLLAERQQGYLTLQGRDDHSYQIDVALPLALEP